MFGEFFKGGCGCEERRCNSSCDALWIIILLLVVFNGGIFGLDICTIILLFIVFGFGGLGAGCGEKRFCDRKC